MRIKNYMSKVAAMLGMASAGSTSDGLPSGPKYEWGSGYGPKEFGMSYIGSNLQRKRRIKAKKSAKMQKSK